MSSLWGLTHSLADLPCSVGSQYPLCTVLVPKPSASPRPLCGEQPLPPSRPLLRFPGPSGGRPAPASTCSAPGSLVSAGRAYLPFFLVVPARDLGRLLDASLSLRNPVHLQVLLFPLAEHLECTTLPVSGTPSPDHAATPLTCLMGWQPPRGSPGDPCPPGCFPKSSQGHPFKAQVRS